MQAALAKLQDLEVSGAPACRHCGNPVPAGRSDGFCCAGCLAVNRLLSESGLERYYELKPAKLRPLLSYFDRRPSLDWIDAAPGAAQGRLELNIEGIQCGACVWAIEKVAAREGGARVGVNSALGRLSLSFEPARFDVRRYLGILADLGYRVRPIDEAVEDRSRGLMLRLGVCSAVAMNTMFFTLPFYLGMSDDGSGLYPLLRSMNFYLTLVSVSYGGSYFFTRAWRSARHGVAHFDIPVALGLGAAFAGSAWAHLRGHEGVVYFDTVNIFLALMLLGRFLQERTLLRNRRSLLKSDAFATSQVTCLEGAPRDIPFAEIRSGARLLLQPGTLAPVDCELAQGEGAEFDRASVTGELRPVALRGGETAQAGSRLVSSTAVRVTARTDFDASLLARLVPASAGEEELPVVWRWTVRFYVAFVLLAAFGGLAYWLLADPSKAATAFISTLVVTCPCGLGIAVPLARTLADRRLVAAGLTMRNPGVLDRLHGVTTVFLDKTGTLTFSHLELADPAALNALATDSRAALMGAAGSSRHPVSRAIFRELSARGESFPEGGSAVEIPGQGVRWSDAQGEWFLGRQMDEAASSTPGRAVLSRAGTVVAAFDLKERVLEDAMASLAQLRARGLQVELLSGDHADRVQAMAAGLGIPPDSARSACSPEDKAEAVKRAPSLMLGDGLNDGPALAASRVSGTPAWERSVVADQADFSFSSGSLSWLPELFATQRALRRALWANFAFATTYNLLLVSFTLRAMVSPLACAIAMPTSSLLVIALTARALRAK